MFRQLTDHRIAPFGFFELATDVSTDLPIQFDQLGVHRLHRLLFGTLNQCKHFIEAVVGDAGWINAELLEAEKKRESIALSQAVGVGNTL